jgi:dihydrofolate reductase
MGKITVVNNVTLDGVMQAPARPDEDTRGGFAHGGWAIPYQDPVLARKMGAMMAGGEGALLLGRRTYEDFCAVWPKRTDNPYTEYLNKVQKYVASTTLKVPLPWQNSILLSGDAADAVATLKREQDKSFTILGSGELIRSLIHLLHQSLHRKHLENIPESFFREQYWYPHDTISQGAVIPNVPLISKTLKCVIFESEAIKLKRKSIEHKYRSISIVEAFPQKLIRVQTRDPVPRQVIWNGSIEKDQIICL